MFSIKRRVLIASATLAAMTWLPNVSMAQDYPNKPIRLIVPWAPGGGTDNIARALADELGQELGQSVIVDNRGGANGVIGSAAVARAAPDGYTLMFSDIFSHVLNSFVVRELPYDIVADFSPITQISSVPLLFVVHPSVPAKNIAELVALAKQKPGMVSYASFGTGSAAHIAGEMLKLMGDIDMVHVPYKGGANALIDTLSGEVQANVSGVNLARQHVEAGKLRALAVTGSERSKYIPDVPTVAETPGFEGFEASVSFAVWAPKDTPPDVVGKLNSVIAKVIATPRFKEKLEAMGTETQTIGNSPEQMAETIAGYVKRLPRVVKAAGLQAQ